MNRNLKILDAVDRTDNVYALVLKLAERAHLILAAGGAQAGSDEPNVVQKVLSEWIDQRERCAGEKETAGQPSWESQPSE